MMTVVVAVVVVVDVAVEVVVMVEVELMVEIDIEVTVDVVVTGTSDAIQVPTKPTPALAFGGFENSIVKEPVAVWPLGCAVSIVVGNVQVAVTTAPAGKRFTDCPPMPLFETTKPPIVPENSLYTEENWSAKVTTSI